MQNAPSIGPMRDDEVATLERWAIDEGWNPGVGDVAIARAVDPDAFIAMRRGKELIAGGSILSYGGQFGFMGLFIVRRDLRHAGLGATLWHQRLARLKARLAPDAAIGMDGVFGMVPFYARGGFTLACRDLRFEGRARGQADPQAIDLARVPFEDIATFDRRYFPAPRDEWLRRWIARPGVQGVAFVDRGVVSAYGVIRPAQTGYKVGPAFASTPELGRRLIGSLLARIEGESVQLDVPEANPVALALATEQGLVESFGCARMYHGPAPAIDIQGIFGITSFEFG
jgi:hypothetical protein